MIWYLLNIAIITFVWFWPVREYAQSGLLYTAEERKKIQRKRFCIIATFNWIILSGCRAIWVGPDTEAYKTVRFDKTIGRSWGSIIRDFYAKYIQGADIKDPGYPLIEKIFQIFSTNYQVFLIGIAVLFFVTMGVFIYKYSRQPYVSFVLFSSLFYTFFAITGHRQTIVTAIVVFMGIELIKKRKLIPFVSIVLLCYKVNKSALCFLPFYWFSKIKINSVTLAIYWVCTVLAFIFRYQLLEFLQLLIGYEQYQDNEGASGGTFMVLLLLVGVVVTMFHKVILKKNNLLIETSINALMIACFFSPLLFINQSFMRVIQYYSLFLLVLLPEIGVIFKDDTDKGIFYAICCIVMIFLLSQQPAGYAFFFWP